MKLQLGELIFDLDARQLRRGQAEIHLSPKAFELLATLIEHRPRALSKQQLHERLWPSTFVSETNLPTLVTEVRQALGDTVRTPRFVRTSHRFGYAFCGEATEIVDTDAVPAREPASFCWLIKDGRRVPLQAGENILGRDLDDGIRIESATVSRRHARIVVSETGATLEDLASKNGTYLGEAPVSETVCLKNGDEIRTGSVVFHFRMTSRGGSTATWSRAARKPR
jgi:DNA-binding winged helix-turn-helix (wHTH) protein